MEEKDQKSEHNFTHFRDSTVMGTTVSHITEKADCPTLIVKDF